MLRGDLDVLSCYRRALASLGQAAGWGTAVVQALLFHQPARGVSAPRRNVGDTLALTPVERALCVDSHPA